MNKTALVALTWDGKDAAGNDERSVPVTFTVLNFDTGVELTRAEVNGAVTDYEMPTFTVEVPDNQNMTPKLQAFAEDAAHNKSAGSEVVSVELSGSDTQGPMAPVIRITFQM